MTTVSAGIKFPERNTTKQAAYGRFFIACIKIKLDDAAACCKLDPNTNQHRGLKNAEIP
jgi:hypothetical protein